MLEDVDSPVDDLTRAMVARADTYLREMSGETSPPSDSARSLGARQGNSSLPSKTADQAHARMLTRTQLADLGNPRSRILKSFVEKLLTDGNYAALQGLGVGVGHHEEHSRRSGVPNPESVISRLPTWSYKQVRTRFDRLHREGLLQAQRPRANGAMSYILPEEFQTARTQFAVLPEPDEVCRSLAQ